MQRWNLLRQLLHLRLQLQHLACQVGQARQRLEVAGHSLAVGDAALLCQVAGEQVQRRDRGRVRLRAADARSRGRSACTTVPSATREAWLPGTLRDRDLQRALAPRLFHRRQRVHRLARLRHRDDQRVRPDQRLPVAHLRGVVELRGQPGDPLHERPPDHRRVQASAHAHEHDPAYPVGSAPASDGCRPAPPATRRTWRGRGSCRASPPAARRSPSA